MMPLFESYSAGLVAMFLATARMGVALSISPFFGGPTGIARRAFVIVCTGIALPLLLPQAAQLPTEPIQLLALVAKEILLGMFLALPAALIFWAISSAGELIDLQRGATAASVFNPFFGAVTSPTANLLVRFSGVIFFATGGFLAFLSAILTSYQIYPIHEALPDFSTGSRLAVSQIMASYFAMAVLWASPFLIVFLLVELGLGLMNRFVPQLNIFFFSMPVKSGLTFFLLIFYTTTLVWGLDREMFTPESLLDYVDKFFQ